MSENNELINRLYIVPDLAVESRFPSIDSLKCPKYRKITKGVTIKTSNVRLETQPLEFADLTGSIISPQLQTLLKVERVWKKCKTNRIAGIVAGVYGSDFENAYAIMHSQMGLTWNPKASAMIVGGPASS